MTQKLLLAESLDLLRQAEVREYDHDKTRERIRGNSRYRGEIALLVQNYQDIYDQFVRGCEILNYVRHQALDDPTASNAKYNTNLSDFCSGKMGAYMDRCENIKRKLDGIFLPLDQVSQVVKAGFIPEDTIFMHDGNAYPLAKKERSITKDFTVMDGTYVLTVKNTDTYSVAAPSVDVALSVTPQRGSGASMTRIVTALPVDSAWRRVIGVVGSSSIQLEIRSSGLRDAHIDVLIQKWRPADGLGGGSAAGGGTSIGGGGSAYGDSQQGGGGYSPGGHADSAFESDYAPVTKPGAQSSDPYGQNQYPPQQQQQQQQWVGGLPAIPDDDLAALANYNVPQGALPSGGGGGQYQQLQLQQQQQQQQNAWAALESMQVPHVGGSSSSSHPQAVPEPIEVNPHGMTVQQRLQKINATLSAVPTAAHTDKPFSQNEELVIQSMFALPLPQDLDS